MNINKLFDKLFTITEWGVAYSDCGDDLLKCASKGVVKHFKRVPNTSRYAFADPLFYSDASYKLLFVEAIDKTTGKGEIGFFDFKNGLGQYHFLIQEKFHMSFPFVFKSGNDYYMIPETNNANQLRLYKAEKFPFSWRLSKILIDGIKCVDTTPQVDVSGNILNLITYVKGTPYNRLCEYCLDNEFILSKCSEVTDVDNNRRGAGPFLTHNNEYYRVSQTCQKIYGESINLYKVLNKSNPYAEVYEMTITKESVAIVGIRKENIVKIHTYSRGDGYEFIDYSFKVFDITKPFRKLYHRLIR